ncbi:MAG: DegV family protein [Ruminococcus sp.]|nr:DegV family protein [Ruminococcus sp.]
MGNKVVLTADRTCDLNKELIAKYKVHDIPLHINLGDNTYDDWETITPEEIYDHFYKTKELPRTAAMSVGEYTDIFSKYIDEGYDIVHISLGSSLSVTHQSSKLAAAEFDGRVHVVDSCNLSTGTGLLVIKAAELIEQGKSAQEVAEAVSEMVHKSHASFVIDKLDFLAAGGRCSAIEAFGANLLGLKPCIEVSTTEHGKMGVNKKYRGKFNKVCIDYMNDIITKYGEVDTARAFVTHAGCDEELVESVKSALVEKNIFDEVHVTRASCTISSHCGPNTLGVLFMTK